MRLRRNWVAEELVESWRTGRQGVLDGLISLASATRAAGDDVQGGRQKKRRKIISEDEDVKEKFSGRTTRARTRMSNLSSQEEVESTPSQIEVIEDSEEGSVYDEHEASQAPTKPLKRVPAPSDGIVPCPGCGTRMKEEAVFAHLDRCPSLGGPGPASPPRNPKSRSPFITAPVQKAISTSLPEDRLPTINYSVFNDKNLRKKLKDLGIPDWGPKPLLQRRHTEWVNLWNANCDSRRPRTKRELLQDLDVWERTQGGTAPTNGNMFILGNTNSGTSNNNVGEKDFDKEGWSRNHNDDFQDLIRKARAKRNESKSLKSEFKDPEKSKPHETSAPSLVPTSSEPHPTNPDPYIESNASSHPNHNPTHVTQNGPLTVPSISSTMEASQPESQGQPYREKPGRVFL
ncbi:putative dna repair protein [Phaeomoniella chlamydospora]|uniref:Postreplication repair E3 ubiquitin-protein ligase RAD18 n=1 Tax=Phaeomoniella chlamydospora TaxID=158046 RepID=A0A0G2EFX8_PHACM|nr:putative dna repair protein [Phaeomoniella chlamydospora]